MRIIPSKPDLPSTELMELHQINSIEHHTDHGEWEPECLYPDHEGELIKGKHRFDNDGFCNICGYRTKTKREILWFISEDDENIKGG